MPELRKDPVIGRWVIIARERARRPGNFIETDNGGLRPETLDCVYCGKQREAIPTGVATGKVIVVPSKAAAFETTPDFQRTQQGVYDVIKGFGAQETVIETPHHLANMADLEARHIRLVFETYAERIQDLETNKQFQYVLVYKNYDASAAKRHNEHARSHIVAAPVRPLRVKEKLIGAKRYFEANQRCVYCDLIQQERQTLTRIIHETEHFISFIPFAARFLFELCIFPKEHHCDFHADIKGKEDDLAAMMKTVLQKIQQGLDDPSYYFVIQTAPFRRERQDGHQWDTVDQDYHWHIELMPRLTRMAGFEKGTGFYICAIPPEDMGEYLRGIKIDNAA